MFSIVALSLAVVALCLPAVAGASPRLNAEQRERLDRGEIVFLDALPPGDDEEARQGGTAVSIVNAPPAAVWRVLVDYPGHAGLYPRVARAEVLESDATRALVRYVVAVGPLSFAFHLNISPNTAQTRLSWRLAQERPNDLFRENVGYWEVEPSPRGSVLTYAMRSRMTLPPFLTAGSDRDGVVQTVDAVRKRVEQR